MTLFKTTFWTGISTSIRLMTLFFLSKIFAVYVGPAGFAIIGQFQNLVQITLTFSGNLIQNGVVKYVAEYRENSVEKSKIISTGFVLCIVSSLVVSLLVALTREYWAIWFLKDAHLSWIVGVFAVAIILFVLNTFFLSVINGEQDIRRYTLINVTGSLVGLLVSVILVKHYRLEGGLLSIVISQSIMFFITLFYLKRCNWFTRANLLKGVDSNYMGKYAQFAVMSIVSALCVPTSQLVLRSYVMHHFSLVEAGYWQAVTRISDAYLMIITTTLSVYYLPKLSSLKTVFEVKKEMKKSHCTVLPIVIAMAFLIFIFKSIIIRILFSEAFMPMAPLFLFQLLGDVFKIGSWLVAYNMLAKAQMRLFIFSEIFFSLTFVGLSMAMMHLFGLRGITMGFAWNYLAYWFFLFSVFQWGARFTSLGEKIV